MSGYLLLRFPGESTAYRSDPRYAGGDRRGPPFDDVWTSLEDWPKDDFEEYMVESGEWVTDDLEKVRRLQEFYRTHGLNMDLCEIRAASEEQTHIEQSDFLGFDIQWGPGGASLLSSGLELSHEADCEQKLSQFYRSYRDRLNSNLLFSEREDAEQFLSHARKLQAEDHIDIALGELDKFSVFSLRRLA